MVEYDAFFLANYSLVVSVAEHRLDSRADAEEIAAEAFRIVWQQYQVGRALNVPWLYGIVRNLIGNEYRRRKRAAALRDRVAEETVNEDADVAERRRSVRDAIRSLPEPQRVLLQMAYWDELSPTEISEILAIPTSTVRVRLFRARRLVRDALALDLEMEVIHDDR
ncbi:hypothetical protein GCM10027416_21150 [Okibacterium endophyticum]